MSSVVRQIGVAALALVGVAPLAHGQVTVRRPTGPGAAVEDSTRVTLSLAVGSQRLAEAKQGRCTHAPQASIFGTLAAMWSVQFAPSPKNSVSLTVWRPLRGDSTPQITLAVGGGETTYRVETVKGTKTSGEGTVQITKRGAGGRFDIDAKTADGATIRGSIDCEKFSAPMAVGGN